MTPTRRALAELKRLGATVQIVETWNQWAKCRHDLFGFIDILALMGPNTIGIQVTTGSNHAARREKILASPNAKAWLKAGNLLEIWSYSKKGGGNLRKLWTLRKEEITLEEMI